MDSIDTRGADDELLALARKFEREGIPEVKAPKGASLEPYMPDGRVLPIQERAWIRYPILAKYDSQFATALVELPGQHSKIQFIISSEHPRPVQRKYGYRHVGVATVFQRAWEDSERERRHFVSAGEMDPAERVFRALAQKQVSDLRNLEAMN